MSNNIVDVNVSTQFAPAPATLQQVGALVSQGGTTLAPGVKSLLTQKSDLTPLLVAPIVTSGFNWADGIVTVTLVSPHNIPIGETVQWTIAGVVPAGYNGTYPVTAVTGTTFTYALVANPGVVTQQGTAVNTSRGELAAMVNTYFANGNTNAVSVLELGEGTSADGVTQLSTFIDSNPKTVYSFLVPRAFATEVTFPALVNAQSGNTALTYFFVSFNSTNYAASAPAFAGMKAFFGFVEADNVPATEFGAAAPFFVTLNRKPSNVNKVPPLQYAFLTGVTVGSWTGPQKTAFKALALNWANTGAEGNITATILVGGVLGSGIYYNFWYATDWLQINVHIALANAVINGSNNTINPLYYNQQGIDRLQAVAQQTANAGVTFGLLLPPAVVNAVDFVTYTTANPADYGVGEYDGLSLTATPQNGFTHIVFNLTVTDLVNGAS